MPISTNLEVSPYFDDYSEIKDYYRVLFKPGVPVQTRELNQLQAILQKQVERFGDNIFQKGTIIDGCHISFHSVFPYIKIDDATTAGVAINVSDYEGFYLKNSANLQAYIVTTQPGFESQSPNLNTLYVKYLNSGNTGSISSYSANQVLTVFKPDNRIFQVNINNGSTGFSNSDSIIVSSAIAVQNSIGGTAFSPAFSVNEYIVNGLGANVQVISVDSTTNSEVVILGIKPQASQLLTSNSAQWTIATTDAVTGLTSGATATVVDLVGTGAAATLRTNTIGKISNVDIASEGSGYYVNPYISVRSSTANTLQISTANLTAQNFLAQVTVADALTTPIGTGYAVTVSEGIIYQKGYFERVEEQLLVVESYANTPDAKVVGFDTQEKLINSNIDDTLLDNALGTQNYTAPGADRLQLTPTLVVKSKTDADANTDFFSIVEFSQGAPFLYNKQTAYNIIEQEMAKRTSEESGNYVLDAFHVNTKSITPFANEANQFITSIDPGLAYINGFRIETTENFNGAANKGTTTEIITSASISLNYGSYVLVKELGGMFDFSTGSVVGLYDTAKTYLTSQLTTVASAGSQIGSARVRCMVLDSGIQGTPNATYRLYLFNISMNTGQQFSSVRSIYQNVTPNGGVADTVLTDGKTFLFDSNLSAVVFQSGQSALKNANSINYTYRTVDTTQSANTSGMISKTLGAGETWPITGAWTTTDKNTIIVIPQANLTATANIAGSVTTSTSSPTVTGTSTTFTTVFSPGDYIKFSNTTANGYGQVSSVINSTALSLTANASIAIAGANAQLFFPKSVPINLSPAVRTANVSGSTLTINLGQATNAANVTLVHNINAANVAPAAKTTVRNVYVRLNLSNNVANTVGPWCLGLSDAFRLRGVYRGANNTFAETDSGITDVTNNFYIDHNQTESVYDTSFLFAKSRSAITLSNTDILLVKLDIFTTAAEGMKNIKSYTIDDTLPLSSLTTSINTLEIPEMYGRTDTYYDLRDCIDFRPVVINTANAATVLANATINPAEPAYSSAISNTAKKFPLPGSTLTATYEHYLGRMDRAVITDKSSITLLTGEPGKNTAPTAPESALTIGLLNIPPYPSLPYAMSANMVQIADTKIANEKYSYRRQDIYKITTPSDSNQQSSQPKGYTMRDIGVLEARIADMEYYVSYLLSQIDALSNTPGNLDGSTAINRFKYGYFVDSYDDNSESDIDNPEFYASFDRGRLVPRLSEFNIQFKPLNASGATGDSVGFGYTEFPLISQLVATNGPVVTANTGNTVSTNTVTQSTAEITVYNRNGLIDRNNWTIYEDFDFKFSSQAGQAELLFISRDDEIAIEIYQSVFQLVGNFVPAASFTAQSAVALNTADVINLQDIGWVYKPLSTLGFLGTPLKYTVKESGKIAWTHDPTKGQYYRVRVYKRSKTHDLSSFVFRMFYPIDGSISYNTNVVIVPTAFRHYGIFVKLTPQRFGISSSLVYESNGKLTTHFCDSQVFSMTISGLRPKTIHGFWLDGVDVSINCRPVGGNLGDPLMTDESGLLSIDFYYSAGLNPVTSDYQKLQSMAASAAGIKTILVQTTDATSTASAQIDITSSLTL